MSIFDTTETVTEPIRMVSSTLGKSQDSLQSEVRQLTEKASEAIGKAAGQVDNSVKDVIDVGTNGLDTEVHLLTARLSATLVNLEDELKADLIQAESGLVTVTQAAHNRIGEMVAQVEDSLVDAGTQLKQPADHLLDRLAWNCLSVGAGLTLLIGLIVVAAVAIAAKGWPSGFGGLAAAIIGVLFIALAGVLTFLPAAKEMALKFVHAEKAAAIIPPAPEIFNVEPNPVHLQVGEAQEVDIHGVHLTPHGALPVVTIEDIPMEIRGAGDHQITFVWNEVQGSPNTSNPQIMHSRRTVQLTLTYPDGTTVGFPLPFVNIPITPIPAPANVVIQAASPSFGVGSPMATSDIVRPDVAVYNFGETPSKPFQITWLPRPQGALILADIPSIAPGGSLKIADFMNGYTYHSAGDFKTEIRSNSLELDAGCPRLLSDKITVKDIAATPPPDPELVRAMAIFRTWDNQKDAATVLDVDIYDAQSNSIAHGESAGENLLHGSTKQVDLAPDLMHKTTKSNIGSCLVQVNVQDTTTSSSDIWRFDWSLRLTFGDSPEPVTIDFGSDELTTNTPGYGSRIMRQIPLQVAMPELPKP